MNSVMYIDTIGSYKSQNMIWLVRNYLGMVHYTTPGLKV